MKQNLGNILLLLLLHTTLFGNELATYTLHANKTDAHPYEPILITFTATQHDHSTNMFFFLTPQTNDNAHIELLSKKTEEKGYRTVQTTFRYLFYAFNAASIQLHFDFIIKTASNTAIAQVYTGGRDNVKWIDTTDSHQKVTPLTFHISPFKHPVALIGDFKLQESITQATLAPYEALHIRYILEGEGVITPHFTPLIPPKNTTLFQEKITHTNKPSTQGYHIKKEYLYALSSDTNFTIASHTIPIYSPRKKRYYTLHLKHHLIEVKKIDPNTIIDTTDAPKTEPLINSQTLQNIFILLFVFCSGYLGGYLHKTKQKKHAPQNSLEKIKHANNPQELLVLLLTYENIPELKTYINELEEMIYTKKVTNFPKLHKKLIKMLQIKTLFKNSE